MDGGTISASAVSSVFIATLRISQVIYELKAVGEQTRDLLDSTTHVETSLDAVRTLRRQKSSHLDSTEKRWIDDVLDNTEKTLGNVAALIEPARVDMQTKFGRVGFLKRGLFVFRDSPKVGTNLARLNLASQSLNTAMNILCTREGRAVMGSGEKDTIHRVIFQPSTRNDVQPPPTYIESEFLNRRRNTHLPKRPITSYSSSTSLGGVEETKTAAETVGEAPCQAEAVAGPSLVSAQEVTPTPFKSPSKSPLDEDNGLQVFEGNQLQTAINPSLHFAEDPQVSQAEYGTSADTLNFEGADGMQVCEGAKPWTPRPQQNHFDEPDGLQVCNGWNAPIPVHEDTPVGASQHQAGQHQERQTNQWRAQQSSYPQPRYPVLQDEQSLAGRWHDPDVQTRHWPYHETGSHRWHVSQPHRPRPPNPPYPHFSHQRTSYPYPSHQNPHYRNLPHQNTLYHALPYPDPPCLSPPPLVQNQFAYQQNPTRYSQNADEQEKQLPPLPPSKASTAEYALRPTSMSASAVQDRPQPQSISNTIRRKAAHRPTDAPQLTASPPSMCPSPVPRRTCQASTSSWTPSELSEASSTSTRKSRGRAWLEFQAER